MATRRACSPRTLGARPSAAARRRRTSVVASAVCCLIALLVGSGGAPAFAQTQAPGGPNTKAFAAYRTCLAKHGVKLPARQGGGGAGFPDTGGSGTTPPSVGNGAQPGGPGGNSGSRPKGVSQKTFTKAQNACRSKRPKGFGGQGSQAFQAYLSCLRDHGVKVPTTKPGQRKTGGGLPNFDRTSPTFQSANAICGALAPGGGAGGGSTSTSTSTT